MRQLPNSSCVVSAPQTRPETRMTGAPSLVTIVNTPSGSVLSPMGICLSVVGSRWPSLRGPSHVSQPERSVPLNKDFHGTFGFADPTAGGSAIAASAQVARQTSAFIFLMLSISDGAHSRAKGPKPPTDRCPVRCQNLSGSGMERGDRVSGHDSIQRSGGQARELGGNTCRVPRGRGGCPQRGRAATKGARLCEPQHGGIKGRVGLVERLGVRQRCCGSQTSQKSQSRAPTNLRKLRKFLWIVVQDGR